MFRRALQHAISSPLLYDVLQCVAGNRKLQTRLRQHLGVFGPDKWVVDVGGGTGVRFELTANYVCLDVDRQKLQRFRSRTHGGRATQADATRCPFRTGTVDAVLCAKVTHHLPDADLTAVLAEIERVTKPGGTLILADAVWSDRWIPRLLWRFDRGSHPRSANTIGDALPRTFTITHLERLQLGIFHEFELYVAIRVAGNHDSNVHATSVGRA